MYVARTGGEELFGDITLLPHWTYSATRRQRPSKETMHALAILRFVYIGVNKALIRSNIIVFNTHCRVTNPPASDVRGDGFAPPPPHVSLFQRFIPRIDTVSGTKDHELECVVLQELTKNTARYQVLLLYLLHLTSVDLQVFSSRPYI